MDTLFAKARPVIFAPPGYPWLIHRLTYRRAIHENPHVRCRRRDGLIGHRQYVLVHGDDTPGVLDGRWGSRGTSANARHGG